ncbi:MAG: nodulation protein NfeD [Anaerolineaceae bacterium]|nr:MAG: nodulation protein NfeD [Anaerolineaceae bacterium]
MRRYLLIIWIVIGLAWITPQPGVAQGERVIFLLNAQGAVTPAMAEYLDRGLERAEREGAEALIFQLDTPGGSIDLMNRMVQRIRNAQIPVVVYIAPRGAMAGSAGTVITLAGHVAAMAPETAIGAASPVGGQGEDLGETIETKQKEILKATVRSLAARRGEEATALAEATIEEATAVSAREALDVGLIDFIATDINDLVAQIDGFVVEMSDGERPLETVGAQIVDFPQSFIEQFLQVLTNPNVTFLLLTVGVQAILIELSAPGGWVAGFIGVVCLALGTYGLGILPVNWFGLVFLITAFVLFVLDIKAPTHGALTAAGLASFIIGSLVLFNSPGTPSFQRVSIPLVVGVGIATGVFFLVVLTFALRAQRRPVEVGAEALIGRIGEVRTSLAPQGMIHVAGELWSAVIEPGTSELKVGERVEVIGVDGLRLLVRPVVRKSS